MIKANYTSIVKCDSIYIDKKIGGSTNIVLSNDLTLIKSRKVDNIINKNKGKVKCVIVTDFLDYVAGEIIYFCKSDFNKYLALNYIQKYICDHGMNKNKVRAKIIAYAKLNRSKKFLAFYSISFPKGMKDTSIRKIHNTVLTRLRKNRNSMSYIWIAERQKNGTLHFHMLTNEYFNIRIVNHMYAKAIQNEIKNIKIDNIKFDYKKYNGVDVKRVNSIEKLSKYLVKYITKQTEKMSGLTWNCSKLVSSLVTHVYLNDEEYKSIQNKIIYMSTIIKDTENKTNQIELDIYLYGSYRPKIIFETLNVINNNINNKFYPTK